MSGAQWYLPIWQTRYVCIYTYHDIYKGIYKYIYIAYMVLPFKYGVSMCHTVPMSFRIYKRDIEGSGLVLWLKTGHLYEFRDRNNEVKFTIYASITHVGPYVPWLPEDMIIFV